MTAVRQNPDSVGKLLADVKKTIELHRSLGMEQYPNSPELQRFMAISPPAEKLPVQVSSPAKPAPQRQSVSSPEKPKVQSTIESIRLELGDCTRCGLHENRSRIIFGYGNPKADLLIVGEWPNMIDDAQGKLFSGADGELLAKMFGAINIELADAYLASVVKCRVPEGVPPQAAQIKACLPFLLSQIEVVAPKVICTMGPLAAHTLLKTDKLLIHLRGKIHDFQGISLIPTFPPSYLLKNPEMKKAAWVDLQLIQKKLM